MIGLSSVVLMACWSSSAPTTSRPAAHCARSISAAIRRRRCAIRRPATVRGASADLARELAKRAGVPLDLKPARQPAGGHRGGQSGAADIGFVAYEAVARRHRRILADLHAGAAELSRARRLPDPRRRRRRPRRPEDRRHAATIRSRSICKRNLKQATADRDRQQSGRDQRMLPAREIDASAANRQRLTTLMAEHARHAAAAGQPVRRAADHHRAKGKAEALAAVNRFIDDVRASGFLKARSDAAASSASSVPRRPWQPSAHGLSAGYRATGTSGCAACALSPDKRPGDAMPEIARTTAS